MMHDDIYQMYLEEVAAIPACTPEEETLLLSLIAAGDEAAKKRLTEGSLGVIVELARGFANRGLPMGDLIQEASMALLMVVNQYQGGDFRAQLEAGANQALTAAVEKQQRESRVEEELLARVNVLKNISGQMAEELGREATVEELAQKMKMTAEEIRDLMKLTLDAMSISPFADPD